MNKPAKILQVLQLLNHRSYVTMDMIKHTCGIPERTVYRYLNTISEANIPVYYDRAVGGYRLTEQNAFRLDELAAEELPVLAACVQLMQRHLNGRYRSALSGIHKKLALRQPLAIEEITSTLEPPSDVDSVPPDYSEQLSLILIQMAVSCRLPVTLTLTTNGSEPEIVPIKKPSLRFHGEWQVSGIERPDEIVGRVRQVEYVSIG